MTNMLDNINIFNNLPSVYPFIIEAKYIVVQKSIQRKWHEFIDRLDKLRRDSMSWYLGDFSAQMLQPGEWLWLPTCKKAGGMKNTVTSGGLGIGLISGASTLNFPMRGAAMALIPGSTRRRRRVTLSIRTSSRE
jgi:hypothetical protein